MPTQSSRPSLKTDLLSRYKNQTVGSAYDAKVFNANPMGLQEQLWTSSGFVTFEDKRKHEKLGFGGTKKYDQSAFLKGFTSEKYKK